MSSDIRESPRTSSFPETSSNSDVVVVENDESGILGYLRSRDLRSGFSQDFFDKDPPHLNGVLRSHILVALPTERTYNTTGWSKGDNPVP